MPALLTSTLGFWMALGFWAQERAHFGGELHWWDSYEPAVQQAVQEHELLFIYFFSEAGDPRQQEFENETLKHPDVHRALQTYVLAKLPVTATWRDASTGKSQRLLDHPAFGHMEGLPALAIIDSQHIDQPYRGRVVSCLPFRSPGYDAPDPEGLRSVKTLLELPPGTITQRTMVYAVRLHPQRPSSTEGEAHPVLFDAARQHSQHQAVIRRQGHHNWGQRLGRIWRRLRGRQPPVEVCAESWPNESLVSACFSCVYAWRQSSGHWGAVRRRHPAYGYDIRRGTNGIWYATGIFGG